IGAGHWGQSSTSLIMSCRRGMRFYPSGSNGFVDARDIARFCVESMKLGRFENRYILVGENSSFRDLFLKITSEFGATQPSIKIPKIPVMLVRKILQVFETIGLSPLPLTSENLSSAYRKVD